MAKNRNLLRGSPPQLSAAPERPLVAPHYLDIHIITETADLLTVTRSPADRAVLRAASH